MTLVPRGGLLFALFIVALSGGCAATTPGPSASPTAEPTAVASPSKTAGTRPSAAGASVALIGDAPVFEPRVLGDYQSVLPGRTRCGFSSRFDRMDPSSGPPT
jgi:hypothetical protein